ncbi:MAG: sugar phosphate nucleotidyltransferase [Nitrospira sp.]
MGGEGEHPGRRWAIILAGGDGVRMQPVVRRWLGRTMPNHYCRYFGTRSLFQHTLDRMLCVTSPARTLVVVGRGHQEAWSQIGKRNPGMVLVQPRNAGTAAGLFLPLTYIRAWDPAGMVVIAPANQFIYPEERLPGEILYAVRAAEKLPAKVVGLAARPDGPESEYNWVKPGHELVRLGLRSIRTVNTFLQRPEPQWARLAYASGALWHTGIMAVHVETLWTLGQRVLPEMMTLFERLGEAINTSKEPQVLRDIYERMPVRSLSRDLLAPVPGLSAVMELQGVWWSDWSHPERIVKTLTRMGQDRASIMPHLRAAVAERQFAQAPDIAMAHHATSDR